MAREPRVSVVVAARDAERFVAEAVESALAQTVPPLEVVVVDDGSTDRTAEVAEAAGARVERGEHGSPGAARNRGVELARGDVLGFLDADDLWEPRKLELQLAALASDPSPDVVLGHVLQFVTPGPATERAASTGPPQPAYLVGVALFRRETWTQVGPFRSDVRLGEFMDWLLRARELGVRDLMLPDVVLRRRIHGANLTIVERENLVVYARVLKASLDRRREREG